LIALIINAHFCLRYRTSRYLSAFSGLKIRPQAADRR